MGQREPLVLVALSGGADSLALAAALAFEAPRGGIRAGAVVIDHGLQTGSADVAERAAALARELELDPVLIRRVEGTAVVGGDGPEAAAREARYRAFAQVCAELGAQLVLTAHTRDDQAEQVLLSLARGSGLRSLAGIPLRRPLTATCSIERSFLAPDSAVTRAITERACAAQQLEPWYDPQNTEARFARVRVRERVLPTLERELGPGVAESLARSADLAAEDAAALDELADALLAQAVEAVDASVGVLEVSVAALDDAPAALRHRAIRRIAELRFGEHLSREHTRTIAALITRWRGQGPIHVPGITVSRAGSSLEFRRRIGSPRESADAEHGGVA